MTPCPFMFFSLSSMTFANKIHTTQFHPSRKASSSVYCLLTSTEPAAAASCEQPHEHYPNIIIATRRNPWQFARLLVSYKSATAELFCSQHNRTCRFPHSPAVSSLRSRRRHSTIPQSRASLLERLSAWPTCNSLSNAATCRTIFKRHHHNMPTTFMRERKIIGPSALIFIIMQAIISASNNFKHRSPSQSPTRQEAAQT